MRKGVKINDLVVGKKYIFITNKRFEYLGEFYEKKVEIVSVCWHDGPEFDIRLKFEKPILENKTFYSLHEQGFIEVDY